MATKLDLKTVFMKLLNVFPKDMYLVHNWCAIAGNESDVENRGFYFCVLEPEVRELLNKTFPNNPVLYIKSVRDAKTNISDIEEILDEKILKNITAIVESFMSKFNNYVDWNTFNFTEEEISALFDEGQSLTLFENDDNRSSIIISKSIFPLVTGKVINEVKYIYDNYEDDDQLNQIIIVYDYELFQLVMRYLFLKI
jgi:hypothetical protein